MLGLTLHCHCAAITPVWPSQEPNAADRDPVHHHTRRHAPPLTTRKNTFNIATLTLIFDKIDVNIDYLKVDVSHHVNIGFLIIDAKKCT